ncbi:MAG: hypothetical protein ABSD62_08020 [Candidatus Limnocylindrales bacterium]|jgi:hypothetical protein
MTSCASALGCARSAAATIRAAVRCQEADQESVAVLSDGDLDMSLGGDAEQSLPDRYRFFVGIEPNRENLLRTFELGDEPLELALLLLSLDCGGAQLARRAGGFVHERRVGLSNCDHGISLPIHDPIGGDSPV